ncbi:hypothetical protein CH63R_09655 [Colletotrichum higginsianum IMI 349063]|uniref:Uncharacterized protein n=1 Tax=Colletotrichum higginsianum (strain IMI 349063) TaxID=759273 RepID=A0A1B7Y808_COLHI|nr:hypothetical protein CH63R_09655 [Colletotrichum higginsianum IMI 349063]OBR08134.1 hypothetical protein CH63R_09655 [Colletotrichum higginsianum IMI 349063]
MLTSPEIQVQLKKEFAGLIAPKRKKRHHSLQPVAAHQPFRPQPPARPCLVVNQAPARLRPLHLEDSQRPAPRKRAPLPPQHQPQPAVRQARHRPRRHQLSARSAPLSAATIISKPTSSSPTPPAAPTIYQARDEAYAECNKLDDIRALDRVAQAHHTWRPKTCFGAGPYTLADVARDFKKRSWSSSSGHATTDDSKAAMLTCTTTATLRKPPSRKRQCVRRATPL